MSSALDVQGEITLTDASKSRSAKDPPERRDPRDLMMNGSPTSSDKFLFSEQRDVSENFVSADELICSYDHDPTHLYTLLEASNWKMASIRCRTHPNEVRTWVIRRDGETNAIRWALLPIHSAVIFQSPSSLVEEILQAYPCGISRRDDQGMMPLHLAFRHKSTDENLLVTLLKQYPNAITSTDIRGRTPLDLGRGIAYSVNLVQAYADCCVKLSTQSQAEDAAKSFFNATKEYETSLLTVKSDYATQIQRLNDHFEKRIHFLEAAHRAELQKIKDNANIEKAKLLKLHQEDIKCLHEVAASTHDNEKCTQQEELRREIEKLEAEVKSLQKSNKALQASLDLKQAAFSEAELQVSAIKNDQVKLKSCIVQQQEELEAANAMRVQLLRTLLQQENDDRPVLSGKFKSIQEALYASNLRIENLSNCFKNIDVRKRDIMKHDTFAHIETEPVDDISAITEHSNM
jgi:hypothetical protein